MLRLKYLKKIPWFAFHLLGTIGVDLYFFFFVGIRRRLSSPNLRQYYASKFYPEYLSLGNASLHCHEDASIYCVGKGVDIGAGAHPFGSARPIDNSLSENAFLIKEEDSSLDYVFSSHCLEHLRPCDYITFFLETYRVLKNNGILYLYLPTLSANLWSPSVLPVHLEIPESQQISDLAKSVGFRVLHMSLLPDAYFSKRIILAK